MNNDGRHQVTLFIGTPPIPHFLNNFIPCRISHVYQSSSDFGLRSRFEWESPEQRIPDYKKHPPIHALQYVSPICQFVVPAIIILLIYFWAWEFNENQGLRSYNHTCIHFWASEFYEKRRTPQLQSQFLYAYGQRNSMKNEILRSHNYIMYILLGEEIPWKMKGVPAIIICFIYFWAKEFYDK